MTTSPELVVVGGGAAGFFGAIACAEARPGARVLLLEKSPELLAKVSISGGGRCNVTHHCFDVARLVQHYPRGGRELQGPFHRFQPRDTVAWFAARGVALKAEADGRMFPVTDRSATIVDALRRAAADAGVEVRTGTPVERLERAGDGFLLHTGAGGAIPCRRVLVATGGNRNNAGYALAAALGHTIEPPVPSLFSFHVEDPRLADLSGLSVADVEAAAPDFKLRQRGALLVTHWGLSGPAILRLSAWGARALADCGYAFALEVNVLPGLRRAALVEQLRAQRTATPQRRVENQPWPGLPQRLWAALAGPHGPLPWAGLSNAAAEDLAGRLQGARFQVQGKSMNKDEFVTCGGVRLREVDFRTMESRRCPGLYFAGEVLDIDAVTGGFNFQAAWTTGWLAGRAMAGGSEAT